MTSIPQIVLDEMALAAQMPAIPKGKRIVKKYAHSEVAVGSTPKAGELAVRVIWTRNEAYSDSSDGDGTGYVREVEEAVHVGWTDALYADLAAALSAGKSMDPGRWRRDRRAAPPISSTPSATRIARIEEREMSVRITDTLGHELAARTASIADARQRAQEIADRTRKCVYLVELDDAATDDGHTPAFAEIVPAGTRPRPARPWSDVQEAHYGNTYHD